MQLWHFAVCGAAGGAIVEILAVFSALTDWQRHRRTPTGRIKDEPPPIGFFIDVPAHAWMTAVRTALGAGAASLFALSEQITGPYVAVALGFSAPAVLAQIGSNHYVTSFVAGTSASNDLASQRIDQPLAAPEDNFMPQAPADHRNRGEAEASGDGTDPEAPGQLTQGAVSTRNSA